MNDVAAMLTTPVLVVEGLRYGRQVAATDVAFDEELGEQFLVARRPFDRHVVELAGRERVEGTLVPTVGRAPDPGRAIDLMVPDRPLRGTPTPSGSESGHSPARSSPSQTSVRRLIAVECFIAESSHNPRQGPGRYSHKRPRAGNLSGLGIGENDAQVVMRQKRELGPTHG
jgi:hypothetical protein